MVCLVVEIIFLGTFKYIKMLYLSANTLQYLPVQKPIPTQESNPILVVQLKGWYTNTHKLSPNLVLLTRKYTNTYTSSPKLVVKTDNVIHQHK